jgi:putative flippase GtrA
LRDPHVTAVLESRRDRLEYGQAQRREVPTGLSRLTPRRAASRARSRTIRHRRTALPTHHQASDPERGGAGPDQARFARSTLTSLGTTALDFAILATLYQLVGAPLALSTFAGSVCGATANFLINRRWTFRAHTGHAGHQVARYLAVQAGSAGLHTGGVSLLAGPFGVPYLVAKLVVAALVYLGWNYPLLRHWVFRMPAPA